MQWLLFGIWLGTYNGLIKKWEKFKIPMAWMKPQLTASNQNVIVHKQMGLYWKAMWLLAFHCLA